ncbi:MAG TPA: efflux RND transporter permease subunit [Phycisphaerae bacterium]|nr:efflux RND transporter permease subunit [Phycisphaerae bacterium]HRY67961.1 efflux RND transporter permease subunit [Phycisphaerae bacterium]HSA26698.1 efflux RND transporter permease subunit [Phycisphaerae bacterium]
MPGSSDTPPAAHPAVPALAASHHGFTNAIVRVFLESNLSLMLILLATIAGVAALLITPREEDPQIVVPLADVYVHCPGYAAEDIEQLVATPLEKLLYHIDGVEYVYSMSKEGMAIITVRYYVGEDRERSLVKLHKKIDENLDAVPPGVTGWIIKPVEIDDVPIVTLTLTGTRPRSHMLRRVAEEMVVRLAAVEGVSRAYVVGGEPRVVSVRFDPDRLQAYNVSPLEVRQALQFANVSVSAGEFTLNDQVVRVDAGKAFATAGELEGLVVGVSGDRPVYLKDVAAIEDGPAEVTSYVRHGWGTARAFESHHDQPGTLVGVTEGTTQAESTSTPAVTIALAKKKGTNAVHVARAVLAASERLRQEVVPDGIDVVITRNAGLTSNEKVNELVEALGVAILFVLAVLTLGLGWREALIVAVAVPVVFGLTLLVNLVVGFTINRVTLFALILSLGLLVDDPIVDVENIARHFGLRRRATRHIVLEAVAEIRPPLITATLAVIVSFLPMSFITGMMGPYMRPMALNVPVAMAMSMLVAFTITPWLTYHLLRRKYSASGAEAGHPADEDDPEVVKRAFLYRLFYPLMAPLLRSRGAAWAFLLVIGILTVVAGGLAATRHVPLKMLPFDNKNELLLVLNFDQGTTLERTDATVRRMEAFLSGVPEVTDYVSYVGLASPMDFNGLVRHYYLRQGNEVAEIRVNLVGKKSRPQKSHAVGLRLRKELTRIAADGHARLSIVETPPGPPVIASIVAEIYGRPDHGYADLVAAAKTVRARMAAEPGVVDVDDSDEASSLKLVFDTDKEKAAINGVSVEDIAATVRMALAGEYVGTVRVPGERNPLQIELRLPRALRSSDLDLSRLNVTGRRGNLVPLAELGRWREARADKTIYHKNLQRVAYVFAETAGRPPADCVVDIEADLLEDSPGQGQEMRDTGPARRNNAGSGWVAGSSPRPVDGRTFFTNGSGIAWSLPGGIRVDFAGEGEWKITLDVFRDLGLAFGAALVGIYILLVGQTRSFVIPVVVMMAIPLTVLGIMPGFWLLNVLIGGQVGGYADSVFFTTTGMIGMIALAGIVTRDSIILVDFIHLSLARGRSLFDAIMESRVVRLRPILLTTATAMLSALPIAIDPIFSGLAWALIFGLLASTVFTLFVIPVTYWLVYERRPGHGLPISEED